MSLWGVLRAAHNKNFAADPNTLVALLPVSPDIDQALSYHRVSEDKFGISGLRIDD
jgi:hypothetical protein